MLRGRISGDNDEKNDNSPPDRLIHFEPEEGSSESSQESASVFGTYYNNIASDDSENSGSKLFGKKPTDNFGNPNKDIEESSPVVDEEPTAVTFQPDDLMDEDLSESSFPLFLSFKANDPAKSVSEALRDKATPSTDETAETIDLIQENETVVESADELTEDFTDDLTDSTNDPFDIPLDELAVPIFKPIAPKPSEENTTTYDIPKVFENETASISTSEGNVTDSNKSAPLFFPLSDVPEESNPQFESDPYEGTVLSDTPQEPASTFNANISDTFSGKKSGFSFFPEFDSTPLTPDSETSSLIQSDGLSLDESKPIVDESADSKKSRQILSADSNETAPIFAPASVPLNFMTEDIISLTPNETTDLSTEKGLAPDSVDEVATIGLTESTENTVSPNLKTRGSSKGRNDSIAAVLKDDGFTVFKEVNSEANDTSNTVLTERPGRNYSSKQVSSTVSPSQKGIQSSINLDRSTSKYTAAQQMGTVAPLPQRYHKKNSRSATPYKLIIIIIVVIMLFIGLWQAWLYFDLGSVFSNLFNSKSEPQVSTFQTLSSASIITSDTSSDTSVDTSAVSETTVPPTSTPTPSPTPSPTPTTKPTETSAETTAETTATTTATTTNIPGEPTKFVTKILNGSSDGGTAYFDLRFENSGSYDSSLVDSLKQITITYESSQTIEEVTSSYFTFVKKEGSTNVFIGTPISTAIIMQDDFVLVDITGVTSGAKVGSFSVKYYIEYNS